MRNGGHCCLLKFTEAVNTACILLLFLLFSSATKAQESAPLPPIICYENGKQTNSYISFDRSGFRTQKFSEFEVTYEGLPLEGIAAFEYAVTIWESKLASSVPIKVNVKFEKLKDGSLAASGASTIHRDFDRRVLKNIWYPVPLAEKIAGRNLNKEEPDINITINNSVQWYFGTDGKTFKNRIDFVSIVLHELAHGLGIVSSADVKDENGIFRQSDYILIYDKFLENESRIRLSSHKSPSKELLKELTSNALFFHGQQAFLKNNNKYPKIFAPINFDAGSSISHLDEDEFPSGDPNSLMSPRFASGEAIHDPGEVLLGILSDIGWKDRGSTEEPVIVNVYPNESDGIFTLSFPDEIGDVELKIVEITGREVLHLQDRILDNAKLQIDLSELPNGLYHLLISSWFGDFKKKLIVVR